MSKRLFFASLTALSIATLGASEESFDTSSLVEALDDSTELSLLDSTIPVVDLNDFFNPETKQQFVEDVARALHEIGFFAVINTGIKEDVLNGAYRASQEFFSASMDLKNEIFDPLINGQRGYVHSEIAQGQTRKDFKEFVHIGKHENLWPSWMDLKTPMEELIRSLDDHGKVLQRAFALAIGEEEDFLTELTEKGECLLRAIHYPPNPNEGVMWAAKHTDIDFFTILPMATEEGLQVFHNDEWITVKVPPNAFIVNGGDKLQNMTNGYFKSSLHQVVSKPNLERYSIVYFVHPRDNDSVSPTENCIEMTGGIQRYPEATSLELLACRLRELKLASPALLKFEEDSGIMQRIEALVLSGDAAEPVILTYLLWKQGR